jgi:hypothetical protein
LGSFGRNGIDEDGREVGMVCSGACYWRGVPVGARLVRAWAGALGSGGARDVGPWPATMLVQLAQETGG